MRTVARDAQNLRPPKLSRRRFLEFGAPLLGLGLADLFRLQAEAAESTGSRPTKSLIVFWTHGGMSQQDTYDMKPDAPPEYRGPYQPIATSAPGVIVTERFPEQSRVMHHLSVVRSVYHGNGIHAPSAHWMQTGYFGPTLARNAPQKPSFGSVISRALGARSPEMPLAAPWCGFKKRAESIGVSVNDTKSDSSTATATVSPNW